MISDDAPASMRGLYPKLGVLAVGLFLVGTNASVIAGVMPELAAEFGVGAAEIGWSITVYAIVVGIASPAVAIGLARWSRTAILAVGLVLVAIGTLVASLAPDLGLFIVGRAVAGLGGAFLVPTSTAAATAIAPVRRRGFAIAAVAVGFTVANAAGAPVGTAVAAATNWRVPMLALAILAALMLLPLVLVVRRVPLGEVVPVRARLAVLRNAPRLWTIAAATVVFTAFNVLYVYAAAASGYTGGPLAGLLLAAGIGSVLGNLVAGPLTDRLGARRSGIVAFLVVTAAALGIALLPRSFWLLVIVFAVWTAGTFATTIPIQHRLVDIDPSTAGVALSWYGTATYLGIAVSPPIADLVLGSPDVRTLLPLLSAALLALGLVAFLLAWPGRPARRAGRTPSVASGA